MLEGRNETSQEKTRQNTKKNEHRKTTADDVLFLFFFPNKNNHKLTRQTTQAGVYTHENERTR